MRENDTDVSVRKNDSVTPLKGLNNQTLRGIQEAPHVCSMKDGKTLLFSWKLKLGSNLCDNCRGGGGLDHLLHGLAADETFSEDAAFVTSETQTWCMSCLYQKIFPLYIFFLQFCSEMLEIS